MGAVAVVVAAGACLTACVQVPDAGPVVQAKEPVQDRLRSTTPTTTRRRPARASSPTAIVTGFLEAMTATPLQTRAARKYLTSAGRSVWEPEQGVVAYSGLRPPARDDDRTYVRLRGADRIGAGRSVAGTRRPRRLAADLPDAQGERRVAHRLGSERTARAAHLLRAVVPGRLALLLRPDRPGSWFPRSCTCRRGSSSSPRWSTPCCCGPRPSLTGVVRTFVPPGLDVDPLVSERHRRGDPERPDPGLLSATTTRLMLSQLAWTLRQDPSVTTFTLTIAGRTITDARGVESSASTAARQTLRPGGARPARSLRPAAGRWSPGRPTS